MASIGKDPGGRKRILFVAPNGKRKTIRLGKLSIRATEAVKYRVEHLLAAKITRHAIEADTAAWVASLEPTLAAKLAAVGLIEPPESRGEITLGPFIESYIAGRANLKENTIRNCNTTRRHLVRYFGDDRNIAEINEGDAHDWRESLLKKYAVATVSRDVKRARQFFHAAVRKKVITENPFSSLPAPAQVNSSREFFVTTDTIEKVIDACPDSQWRLIVALSRYGGLRCPSEHLTLTWDCVNWERNRLTVKSPKTERHPGGESRVIPLFPKLRPYLESTFDEAEPGSNFVITRYRKGNANLRTQMLRIIERAGVNPWPRLFHNLRASRQTELTSWFPLHVVCDWIGNSALVAQAHYLQTTDDHFEKASTEKPPERCAAQNPAQQSHVLARNGSQTEIPTTRKPLVLQGIASQCDSVHMYTVPPARIELTSRD